MPTARAAINQIWVGEVEDSDEELEEFEPAGTN